MSKFFFLTNLAEIHQVFFLLKGCLHLSESIYLRDRDYSESTMPLRCWRYRFAYRAVFLICVSWYAVQLIQTCFLSSQENRQQQRPLQYKSDGTREMPEQSYNKLSEMRRVNNSSEPRVKVDQFLVSGQREEEIRKSLKINSDDNLKRRLEGGSQRKLKVVDTRSNLQGKPPYHHIRQDH